MSIDSKEINTPCYVINKDVLCAVAKKTRDEIIKFFPGAIISYSVKTNYHPYILDCLNKCGFWAEVVSEEEYYLVKKLFTKPSHIVYNGPVKAKTSFLDAIRNGCIVNLDSYKEIEWLYDLPKDKKYKVGLRVNYSLADYSDEYKNVHSNSRFGFSINNSSFEEAINRIKRCGNIEVNVLHMHRGGTSKSYETYRAIAQISCDIISKYNLNIDYIDIGGGFRIGTDDNLNMSMYMETIKNVIIKNALCDKISFIFEPGNSIVYPCVDYVARVFDRKVIDNKIYIILDGSRLHTDPLFNRKYYADMQIYRNEEERTVDEAQSVKQILCGYTCMEKDRFAIINTQELVPGDIVIFKQIGAYTMALSPNFIKGFPYTYIRDRDKDDLKQTGTRMI